MIKPLNPYSYTDTVGHTTTTKYFFMDNYSRDSSMKEQVTAFAFRQKELDRNVHYEFEVYIYQKTKILNESFVSNTGDNVAWHTKDVRFMFRWADNEYMGYLEYENGNCLNCDIDIKDIKRDTIK
jgi:hypothetical protein